MNRIVCESLAPIVLFVYNRLSHTKQTIEALENNILASESQLIIYSDNYKDVQSREMVEQVRAYIKTINGFKSVTIIEREYNFGLSKSIIDGVTEIVEKYGRVIVLEDDLVTSRFFLRYMNESLEYYQNCDKVISIHGYMFPVDRELPETFFLKAAHCWGWGTWQSKWKLFNPDGKQLLRLVNQKKLDLEFDYDGASGYTQMLQDQVDNKIDSWAIRWYASAFVANKLTLYPGISLVKNIGLDSSGTHGKTTNIYDTKLADKQISIRKIDVVHNIDAYHQIREWLLTLSPTIWGRIINKFRRFLPSIS